jgi:hypothetical protein
VRSIATWAPSPSARDFPQRIEQSTNARLLGIDDSKVMPVNDDREDPLVRKAHDLDELVAAGESEKTPFILLGRVWIVIAAAVLVIFALAMLAYSLAT